MFDSKIIIYVKFWARKWYQHFFGRNFPPLIQSWLLIYDLYCPEPPRWNRPPHRDLLDIFKNTYVCSPMLNDRSPGEKCILISIRAVFQPRNQQKVPFLHGFGHFLAKWLEHCHVWDEGPSLFSNIIVQHRTTHVSELSFFEKQTSDGLRYEKKRSIFRGQICKMGAKHTCPDIHMCIFIYPWACVHTHICKNTNVFT